MHFSIWLRKGPNYWEGRGAEVTPSKTSYRTKSRPS